MSLKHRQFLKHIADSISNYLPKEYASPKFIETHWQLQFYYGNNKRIHYEVSRVWNRQGRQIEIGLHFETRNKQHNRDLLHHFDHHLVEICAALEDEIKAEQWDRGWTKIYQLFEDQTLDEALVESICQCLAAFVGVVQPIYEQIDQGA